MENSIPWPEWRLLDLQGYQDIRKNWRNRAVLLFIPAVMVGPYVKVPSRTVIGIFRSEHHDVWSEKWYDQNGTVIDPCFPVGRPTHWMPLPSDPV